MGFSSGISSISKLLCSGNNVVALAEEEEDNLLSGGPFPLPGIVSLWFVSVVVTSEADVTSSADAGAETELATVPGDAGLPRPGDEQNNSTSTYFDS